MARHILHGDVPVFMYGQDYVGSAEALLAALLFRLFGESVLTFRLSALLFFALFLLLHGWFVQRWWNHKVMVLSLVVAALPGWGILWWMYRPIAAYGPLLVAGTAVLLLAQVPPRPGTSGRLQFIAIGLVAGAGLWLHPMMLHYLAPVALLSLLRLPEWSVLRSGFARWAVTSHRDTFLSLLFVSALFLLLVVAFFVGSCRRLIALGAVEVGARFILSALALALAGAILYVSERNRVLVQRVAALGVGALGGYSPVLFAWITSGTMPTSALREACPTGLASRVELFSGTLFPTMWGLMPRSNSETWSVASTILLVLAAALVISAILMFLWQARDALRSLATLSPLSPNQDKWALLLLWAALPLLLVLLADNALDIWSVRYLVAAWQASTIILGWWLYRLSQRSATAVLIAVAIWVIHLHQNNWTGLHEEWQTRAGLYSTTAVQSLESYLASYGVDGGYAGYWESYPLDAVSRERLVIAPYTSWDRYPAYTEMVEAMPRYAVIIPPDAINDGATTAADLATYLQARGEAEELLDLQLPSQVATQRLIAREHVANWDVWLLERQR